MAIIPTVYGGGGGVLANGQTLGAAFPPMLDRISWLFPLRHATRAMSTATATDVVGSGLSWDHLGALLAWTVAGLIVVAWRFSWVNLEPPRRRRPSDVVEAAERSRTPLRTS